MIYQKVINHSFFKIWIKINDFKEIGVAKQAIKEGIDFKRERQKLSRF